MFRPVSLSLVLACVVAAAACAPAAPPAPPQPAANAPADIAAINAARAAFAAAYTAGDAAAVGRLYAADAISEPNGQPTLKGRDAIVGSLTAMFQQVSIQAELKADETWTQGTVGVDRGRYTVTVTPKNGGAATSTEGRYIVVFAKDADGSWKVSRDMDNLDTIAAPAPEAKAASAK